MKRATVSIITRTKNRPVTLIRAIQSIENQTFGDYVHVIVNDGGNPEDVDKLIASCRDETRQKIHVIHNSHSVGMEAASNIGIHACDSTYILIHDDDDSLMPEFLEHTIAFLRENEGRYCGVSSWIMLVNERIQGDAITPISETLYSSIKAVNIGQMAVMNQLVPIAFLYKRSVHDEIGYYDEALPVLGDWDFFLRLLAKYDIGILPQILARYHKRVSDDTIYANSLTCALDKHAVYTQLIRNRMFRQDAQDGKIGIGLLCQISSLMQTIPFFSEEAYIKETIFQVLANRAQSVAIYGTGNIAAKLFHELRNNGIRIDCFIENIVQDGGKLFFDAPVLSLQDAVASGYCNVVIGSWEYKTVIIDRIHGQVDAAKTGLRIYSA